MNPNYTNTELLTRYLDGELDNDQSKKLESRIKEDDNLKEELNNLKNFLRGNKVIWTI